MAEAAIKLPIKTGESSSPRETALQAWRPFDTLRREMDRLFGDFEGEFWGSPFRRPIFNLEPMWRRETSASAMPAVDITEKDKAYEITAELPGMDEKNIEVNVANGTLTIKGEKQEVKEEKKKDYYLRERNYGSFERCFRVPEGVDADKIEANFKKGVLTVTLPKTAEAQQPEKKIAVKAA
jgi:HSP20 family protein